MYKKPIHTCLKVNCSTCIINSKLNCHFNFGQLLRFYLIVLPSFIISGIGIYNYSITGLVIWLAIIGLFFQIIEIRVLCTHCPHYAELSYSLRCWANYGALKLWKYIPGPMNFPEKTILILGFIVVWGYPIIFIALLENWILLIANIFSVIIFFTLLRQYNCKKCINFSCPLNIVDIEIREEFRGFKLTKETWIQRLRFRKITRRDMLWAIGGLILVGVFSGIIMKGLELTIGKFDHSPSFMSFEPLTKGRYWLLLVWFPYWILNILGEEILWRGVMLPRQEIAFGKYAWVIHGFGWGLFHIAFGWQLLITLIPLIFIQSYVVQKTKNSWIGVIMHGGLNGPSFIAISFGLI